MTELIAKCPGRHSALRLLLTALLAGSVVAWTGGDAVAKRSSKRIPPLTEDGLPNVQADRAVVMDVETGAELYGKNAGKVGGIASTTKIFVGMVVRQRKIDLDAYTEITKVDRDYARGGARTRLDVRHSFKNVDLLRAMLIASDNRAPTALGRAVGLTPDELIAAMNELAKQLGLKNTKFTDPSGLRGNESTARDMALAFKAALADPVLAEIMATREASVQSKHSRPRRIFYRNTNNALHADRYEVTGGKTGFTRFAGYCLVISAKIADRDVIMVFLGERDKLTRFGDFNRVSKWLTDNGFGDLSKLPRVSGDSPPIGAAASGVGAL